MLLNIFDSAKTASIKLDIDKQRLIGAICDKRAIDDCYFITADMDINELLEYRKTKTQGKKKVYQYDLNENYINSFDSLADAARACNLKQSTSISQAIKKFSESGGYKWSFIKADKFPEINLLPEVNKSEMVGQYDEKDKLVKVYETVLECQKDFPYCRKVLRGERKSSQGYVFKYMS
jgi:hypothetical protein